MRPIGARLFQRNYFNHMMSRHKRPSQPLPFKLTTRDLDVLKSVYHHRFLTAAHIHTLHFHPSSIRVAQIRLQYLWAANLLDRTYLTPELPDVRDRYVEQPLYSIATRGAFHLEEAIGKPMWQISHTKAQNQRGFAKMRHNLVFADLATSFEAFAKRNPPWLATVTREDVLQNQVGAGKTRKGAIVPDGATTLAHSAFAKPQTLLVEVVRARVRAGNDSIRRKMLRYREALRVGFFRNTYGFDWVRNVLFLTTTMARAKNLAALARNIPGAENLFRFGAYETRESNRVAPKTLLTPERLGEPVLITPSGRAISFLPPFSNPSTPQHV